MDIAKIAIHCPTYRDWVLAHVYLEHKNDIRQSGKWEGEDFCYTPDMSYADLDFFEEKGYSIMSLYEYAEYEMNNPISSYVTKP